MTQPRQPPARSVVASLVLIAVVIGCGAAAFAYTAGWFSPQRLTPDKFVEAFMSPGGPPLGHRRKRPMRHYPHLWISARGLGLSGTSTPPTRELSGSNHETLRHRP